jgi:hypothetical protein
MESGNLSGQRFLSYLEKPVSIDVASKCTHVTRRLSLAIGLGMPPRVGVLNAPTPIPDGYNEDKVIELIWRKGMPPRGGVLNAPPPKPGRLQRGQGDKAHLAQRAAPKGWVVEQPTPYPRCYQNEKPEFFAQI